MKFNNYNIDYILTAAKNHRCRCEGVCNEWGDKWFTSTSKVSTEKRVHNKNIFFGCKHLTTIYYF